MHKMVPQSLSFWERSYFEKTDWLVVGAGLVGLQSATEIKKLFPHKRVVVVDASAIGNAASLKNAGFACFGSAGELLDEIARSGEEEAFELYSHRFYGIQKLLQKFGADAIGFEPTGGFEIFTKSETDKQNAILDSLPSLNKKLYDYLNHSELFSSFSGELRALSPGIFTAVSVSNTGMEVNDLAIYAASEGPIQTHKLYRAVRIQASAVGVEIIESVKVSSYEDRVGGVNVFLDDGQCIHTEQLLICTNGFTKNIDASTPVYPARGQVFITEPLVWQPLHGIYHADDGYIYFRSLGDRILIGGGRNKAFVEEETMQMQTTPTIKQYIQRYVEEVILPTKKGCNPVRFEWEWSGIMGMGIQRTPIIQADSNRVYKAVRMGGMGVALSAWVAEEVIQLIKKNDGAK